MRRLKSVRVLGRATWLKYFTNVTNQRPTNIAICASHAVQWVRCIKVKPHRLTWIHNYKHINGCFIFYSRHFFLTRLLSIWRLTKYLASGHMEFVEHVTMLWNTNLCINQAAVVTDTAPRYNANHDDWLSHTTCNCVVSHGVSNKLQNSATSNYPRVYHNTLYA